MTDSNEVLRKRLTEHINKTGFPLEIQVLQALSEQQGWLSWSNQMYVDPDEKKPREVDVGGFYFPWLWANLSPKTMKVEPQKGVPFTPSILVECKTSNDCSLVLFPTRPFSFLMLEGQTLELPFLFGKKKFNIEERFGAGVIGFAGTRFHYNNMVVSNSYTLTKPGEIKGRPDIYEAVTVLMKAQSETIESIFATWKQNDAQQLSMLVPKDPPLYPITFGFLAIAFQGPMLEAKLVNGELVLNELTHGCISSAYWSNRLERPVTYVIDVVKSTNFREYLAIVKKDLDTAENVLSLYDKEARSYLSR